MFKYNNININYKDYGDETKDAIVYLHGWGQNIAMMEPIANPFVKTNRLIIIDLPGFGESDQPDHVWELEEYAQMVNALITSLKIKKVNLIGHSFGGKIALVYATKYKVNKLMLLSSPFRKSTKTASLKTRILKKAASIPGLKQLANKLKKHIGSTDYRNANPLMREILVKHINTDYTDQIKNISCPTFIIWGDQDDAVDVEDAYVLKELIKDSGLEVYQGCTHYAYLERLNQTNAIIKAFFN